ncbi:cell division protein FtsX [Fundidesulfovibrio putealis]|uniref:cell division protein FtsX n=1 Tax=Fundidesulfovibrio putealis TaxID=270496 RepID=UPI0003FEF0E5|nr:permease-like cell division protein FtsX [Fundidesulfovibrio putealis]
MTMLGRAFARAFIQLARSPGLHAMAALALALTCFLAGAFGLFLSNLDSHLRKHQGHAQFQIYWKPGTDMAQVRQQWDAIRSISGVDEFVAFTPDQALESLKRSMGDGMDFSWMGASPMPATALASLRVVSEDARPARIFLERLKALPGVDKVRINPMQLDVATALRSLSMQALVPLSVSLSLAIAMVAYLAARLCLEGRRAEVEIMRLVGAQEWFVRLPWAVSAGFTGLIGALLGLGALYTLQLALSGVLYEPPLWIRLGPLPLEEAGAMLLMALAMSSLGGWLAARE